MGNKLGDNGEITSCFMSQRYVCFFLTHAYYYYMKMLLFYLILSDEDSIKLRLSLLRLLLLLLLDKDVIMLLISMSLEFSQCPFYAQFQIQTFVVCLSGRPSL